MQRKRGQENICITLKLCFSALRAHENRAVGTWGTWGTWGQSLLPVIVALIRIIYTVAVWTPKNFFPLLIRPQGSQGCQKITFYFLQMKLFSFCAKIAPKRHKLQKPSKLKKKCQKNPVFLDFFKYSSIWGQS